MSQKIFSCLLSISPFRYLPESFRCICSSDRIYVVIFSLSAPIRNYDYVSTVIFFHHRDTEDTEGIFVLPIGRRRWAKKSIRWMKMPNLRKVARPFADKTNAFCLPPSPGKQKKFTSQCSLRLCGEKYKKKANRFTPKQTRWNPERKFHHV